MTLHPPASAAELLNIGRDLIVQEQFDAAVVLSMLEHMQFSDLDVQAHGAVTHARLAAQSARNGSSVSRDAIARFALARVVTLLEEHMEVGCEASDRQVSR